MQSFYVGPGSAHFDCEERQILGDQIRRKKNSGGNTYCAHMSDRLDNVFHYDNADGTRFYRNPDGTTFFDGLNVKGLGFAKHQAPDGRILIWWYSNIFEKLTKVPECETDKLSIWDPPRITYPSPDSFDSRYSNGSSLINLPVSASGNKIRAALEAEIDYEIRKIQERRANGATDLNDTIMGIEHERSPFEKINKRAAGSIKQYHYPDGSYYWVY